MKYCSYCGTSLVGSAARFCAKCGKTILSNDGYDGYYNDVKPIDNGHTRDRIDPELVKRIIYLAVGAFACVMLSVILMYLL